MKRTILKLLAVCIALSVSIGSTIAYLTDSDGDVNVMTLGHVEINLIDRNEMPLAHWFLFRMTSRSFLAFIRKV